MRSVRSAVARSGQRGLTLIELLGVLALVAVLAAVALPSYLSYRVKVKISQARADIMTMGALIQAQQQDLGAYPADLTSVKLDAKLDPWGRSYVYYNVDANGRGGARKDHALNPINSDFDLYSLGPDGRSKSQVTQKDSLDDVIRANNGGFVGLASDF